MATIMIVDDVPEMVNLIRDVLLLQGHKIIPAHGGEEALEKLESVKPDLILLDVMMPNIDGIEVCKRIKENPETSGIPVVLVTGKRDIESHLDAIMANVDGYILKPFSVKDLQEKVIAFLEKEPQAWCVSVI